jgi:phage terminase large subunit
MSIEEQMKATHRVRIVKRLSLEDGINAARTIFPQCYFDEQRCADGLQALRHYQYEIQESLGILSRVPKHDWSSHAADAFRYSGVAAKAPRKSGSPVELGPHGVGQLFNEQGQRSAEAHRFLIANATDSLGWMQ